MKRPQLTSKLKQVLTWSFLVLSVLFLILLFVFKDTLNNFASKAVQAQSGSIIQISESAFIDSVFNYSKNGLSYQVTFLDFGAKGCSACKRMETVMGEIKARYPNHVNVVFVNILLPKNQGLMKYYGIATIPTQVLLNIAGKEYFRHSGYYSVEELEKILTSN